MVFNYILEKIAWNANEKKLETYNSTIKQINEICETYDDLTPLQIKEKTQEFKEKIQNDISSLDEILPEAFALHKQACKQLVWTTYKVKGQETTWNMIPYDVQILWGIILHEWAIAEMKTWEWKTLVATFSAYLNSLSWKWVHLVTVNDYLAERDAETMKPLYDYLGVSVWFVSKNVSLERRRWEYEKDITYVENSELGFDYLRDNLAKSMDDRLLLFRELNYAIVDEADSIMIDEARTPLIISQPSSEPTEKYIQYAKIVQALEAAPLETEKKKSWLFDDWKKEEVKWDYKIDMKAKTALLTWKWIQKLEKILQVENLYKELWYDEIHHIENALKAKACYIKDKDYLVHNNEVLIIDENTGRAMPWRRYSEWLHQAIESKEWVTIQKESETVATITYQNFLKLYNKLTWMTGTASTEWEEFEKIYESSVVVIPTNESIIRVDKQDKVFFDQDIKFNHVVKTVKFYTKMWLPFLLGTSSVQSSEILSWYLQRAWLQHSVLNAKYHEMEAKIVSNAGKSSSIIVATNMAGRWTDIKLEKWLFNKISKNYAEWIDWEIQKWKWVLLTVYSEFEFDKLLEALKDRFKIEDDKILQKEDNASFSKEWLFIKTEFNKRKKSKEQLFCKILIKDSESWNHELEEKQIHMWLYVLASEKHESRRIDNQLRWRSWRQWDPGMTQFYVALDDDLMIKSWWLMTKTLAWKILPKEDLENFAIENSQIAWSIARAQRQMEAMSFSIRKNLFEYDSVLNKQRQVIYSLRDSLLRNEDMSETVSKYIEDVVSNSVKIHSYDDQALLTNLEEIAAIDFSEDLKKYKHKDLEDYLSFEFKEILEKKKEELWESVFQDLQKDIMLENLDRNWMKHIDEMMYLRDKVSMYGYAQVDPLLQYKKEAFDKYQSLMLTIKTWIVSVLLKMDTSKNNTFTELIEFWSQEHSQDLIKKLRQAWEISESMEEDTPKKEKKVSQWPKVIESNDDFEVIELWDDENSSDSQKDEIIKKMLWR